MKTYPFDPDRAIALLESAGFTETVDGVRQNAAGDKLSFEFMTRPAIAPGSWYSRCCNPSGAMSASKW